MSGERPFRWLLLFAASAAVLLAAGLVTPEFDSAVLAAAQLRGPAASTALNLSALGSVAVLALVVLAAAGFLAFRRQPRTAMLLILSAVLGEGAMELLKLAAFRARPPSAALYETFGASFPSGHAMMAGIVYLTLGTLLARAEDHAGTRRYLIALAIGLTALVGLTRVALGVHWPTDVLAGWALGALWAYGAARLTARLQRAGAAEPPA